MPEPRPAHAQLRGAIWTPLGISHHKSEIWYHLQIGGEVRTYRPTQVLGEAFLLGIYPDFEFWRSNFPSRYFHGQKLDTRRACWYVCQKCIEAGEYNPANCE